MTHLGISRRIAAITLVLACGLLAAPTVAGAISRDEVVARGKVWVTRAVPYSQSGYADEGGALVSSASEGYRRDCSGFVSMALALKRDDGSPLSLDTATLPSRLTKISKDDLQPGDVILRPKNQPGAAYGHAVLFVAWVDAAKTRYIGYHESSSAGKTVQATITYPFWGETGFAPYRYEGIEQSFEDVEVRIDGADRYETAARSAQLAFPDSAPAVVVASGENWPDALGGAALAGALEGPLLLTRADALPTATRNEIVRLAPSRVIVLGGEGSVSDGVVAAIDGLVPAVERIGGRDRYDTAAAVARRAVTEARAADRTIDTAYVVSGADFPDALAASPVSAYTRRPILLVAPDSVPLPTSRALRDLSLTKIEIIGGTASVDAAVEASLVDAGASVHRIADRDRYRTSVLVARHGVSLGMVWGRCGLASGEVFSDALAGGAAQGRMGTVVLLTSGTLLPERVGSEIASNGAAMGVMHVYGGTRTITYPVREEVARLLRAAR